MKFLYLHGSESAGFGNKVNVLRKYFGDDSVINPNLPPNNEKAVSLLNYLVENLKHEDLFLVGSSLGGYFALYLAVKYDVHAILINPLIKPEPVVRLEDLPMENFKTGEKYIYKKEWSEFLFQIEQKVEDVQKMKNKIFIYLDEKDDVLDSKTTAQFFEGFYVKIFPGGSHFFEHMEEMAQDIKHRLLKNNDFTNK
jgi:predicted esterase YcpF (UPF0227 family)